MNDTKASMAQPRVQCIGAGQPAVNSPSGFYACPVCGAVLGVVLSPRHATPAHDTSIGLGRAPFVAEEHRFYLRPEHRHDPLLMQVARDGLSKDWAIDLLLKALVITRARAEEAERKAPPPIVLTGFSEKPS